MKCSSNSNYTIHYSSSELGNPRGHLAAQTKLKLIGRQWQPIGNDQKQVAEQRCLLNQWFAPVAHSWRLRKKKRFCSLLLKEFPHKRASLREEVAKSWRRSGVDWLRPPPPKTNTRTNQVQRWKRSEIYRIHSPPSLLG